MKSFEAKIYVGFKEFTNPERTESNIHTIETCEYICQTYCNILGLCVTVTPTTYIYTRGTEPGAIIGLIQYPRFPDSELNLKAHALALGKALFEGLGQYRVTINFPDEVIMLSSDKAI